MRPTLGLGRTVQKSASAERDQSNETHAQQQPRAGFGNQHPATRSGWVEGDGASIGRGSIENRVGVVVDRSENGGEVGGTRQVRRSQIGKSEIDSGQAYPCEVRAVEIRSGEACANHSSVVEIRVAKVRVAEVRTGEGGVRKAGAKKLRPGERGAGERRSGEIGMSQAGLFENDGREVSPGFEIGTRIAMS